MWGDWAVSELASLTNQPHIALEDKKAKWLLGSVNVKRWFIEQTFCLAKLSSFFLIPPQNVLGIVICLYYKTCSYPKPVHEKWTETSLFIPEEKQLLCCFPQWAENLERNLKLKKAKNSKRFIFWTVVSVALAQGKICSWEKGLPGARFFFNSDSSSWSGFKSICCYYFFINRNILYGLCDSCLQVKQPLVPCFLAISVSFRSYTQTVIGQFERPLQH